jgi:hypothetical protein
MGDEVRAMMDETFGIWPHDDEDLSDPLDLDEDRDEDGDACEFWDGRMEERRIDRA